MSLLMQALKKAERAKQNAITEDELEKPSQAFDALLSLPPQAGAQAGAQADAPAASPLGLEPLPETRPPLDFADAAAATPPATASTATPPDAAPAAPAPQRQQQQRQERQQEQPARPRSAPQRSAPALDPGTLRLAALSGLLLLVVGGLGGWYWLASNAPGAGSALPMVPMPAPNAGPVGAAPVLVLAAPEAAPAMAPDQTATPAAPYTAASAASATNTPAASARPHAAPDPGEAWRHAARFEDRERGPVAAMTAAAATARPETLAPAVSAYADNSQIKVLHNDAAPQINPALQSAYLAFKAGDLVAAGTAYDSVLRQEPANRDALLGLAALALRGGQERQAAQRYLRLLELDPNDADALAGLSGLRQGDPAQTERRLKDSLRRAPDNGPLLFALGNLYAQQTRWSEAQQLYFRAYNASPENADYAFNLAIGLDRLNQPRLAVNYYQRALVLLPNGPAAIDAGALRRRLRELGASAD